MGKSVKLIIQIPALNETGSLAQTLAALPRTLPGITAVETLVVDDGSEDGTDALARQLGVTHVIRHSRTRGLAQAFQTGLDAALRAGADIVVNTDADNQYDGRDVAALVAPILAGAADIVIGDRQTAAHQGMSPARRRLQRLGSGVVSRLARMDLPDAVSGFRALSRSAAQRIHIFSDFSYTTEMLIQAGAGRMRVVSVPVRCNPVTRPSRLFSSVPGFIARTGATVLRTYAMHYPLRVFLLAGGVLGLIGALPILRFLYFYAIGDGAGHIQSLVIGGTVLTLGVIAALMGVLADLIGRNRQLSETVLLRLKELEDTLGRLEDAGPHKRPPQ